MVERTPVLNFFIYIILVLGISMMLSPLYLIFTTATITTEQLYSDGISMLPSSHLWSNLQEVFNRTELAQQLFNSLIVSSIVIVGKISLALLTAFAIVFFRLPFKNLIFWMILITLMLPLEVRIVPTYEIVSNILSPIQHLLELTGISDLMQSWYGIQIQLNWSLLNSYTGLTLPLMASAIGTFLFRQFYKTVPNELVEAAKLDGVNPFRFFIDILLPLSRSNILVLSILIFISTWNAYLWPLLITTDLDMRTASLAITELNLNSLDQLPEWNVTMAAALITLLPPVILIAIMYSWLLKEK